MKIFIAALLVLLTGGYSAIAQKSSSDTRLRDIDKELQSVLDTWKAAGFAVAVVEKTKLYMPKVSDTATTKTSYR